MTVPQLQTNNLTNVESIYDCQIHTISIRRKDPFNCEKHDFKILDSPQKNFEVLTQIFEYLDDDQEHFIILVFILQSRSYIRFIVIYKRLEPKLCLPSPYVLLRSLHRYDAA